MRWSFGRVALTFYLLALVVSTAVRCSSSGLYTLGKEQEALTVPVVTDGISGSRGERPIRIAYRRHAPRESAATSLPILLLHGSPGSSREAEPLATLLRERSTVYTIDLPGFGASQRRLPDYSFAAHAEYVAAFAEAAGLDRFHVVGFSMGGGVAITLAENTPERVASLTLLSSIGVQELELLGNHHANRAIHGLQLVIVQAATRLVPHMGLLDDVMLGVPYARNFYDSDQRPLRSFLLEWDGPTLVLHGTRDELVPVAAAREHARIVPQSELVLLDEGHFFTFMEPDLAASVISPFVHDVERGDAPVRASANPERIARGALPFDPESVPPARGLSLLILGALIVAGSFVSEDLACIAAGLLAAPGRITFTAAVTASLIGILVGDIGLYLIGRLFGPAILARAPLRWIVPPARVARARKWFRKKGLGLVIASRFVPGSRLPTYVAAGMLGTSIVSFTVYLAIAALVWTPILVGLSMLVGDKALELWPSLQRSSATLLAATGLALVVFVKLILPIASHRGRRRLLARWKRTVEWEFWPAWMFYAPLVPRIVALGRRAGGLTLFTAANPGMPHGGFVGESKFDILASLGLDDPAVARTARFDPSGSPEERWHRFERACRDANLELPLVLKPDVGERGRGVAICRTREEVAAALESRSGPLLVQEYVPGVEFGVFYARRPGEPAGRIISVTEKRMPRVTGDGRRRLEELIWDDPRAVAMARVYVDRLIDRIDTVPDAGEEVELVEMGTHCRGALFFDGEAFATDALREEIERLSRRFDGFHFGRYDLRAPSLDHFRAGRDLRVIELNGVTSESTHVYDPRHSLRHARRTILEQWRLAYEIGRENVAAGHRASGWKELARLLTTHWGGGAPPRDRAPGRRST